MSLILSQTSVEVLYAKRTPRRYDLCLYNEVNFQVIVYREGKNLGPRAKEMPRAPSCVNAALPTVEECDFDRQFLFDEYVAISHCYDLKKVS